MKGFFFVRSGIRVDAIGGTLPVSVPPRDAAWFQWYILHRRRTESMPAFWRKPARHTNFVHSRDVPCVRPACRHVCLTHRAAQAEISVNAYGTPVDRSLYAAPPNQRFRSTYIEHYWFVAGPVSPGMLSFLM